MIAPVWPSYGKIGLPDQMRGDAAVDDAEPPAHDLGSARKQEAQRIRDAQHLLTHRLLRKHLIDQQRGASGHTSGAAAGTERTLLAAEGDQVLGMATVATHPQKAALSATHSSNVIPPHVRTSACI